MSEGKTNMFGKTYNTIGSTESNFIIKTKGDVKIQWGNKYIDLLKNGKIASSGDSILKVISDQNQITQDGIYITSNEEVWISIGGNKVNLTGKTSYISYLEEQKEITQEQKYISLKNIGFYYDSLEDAKQSGITSGIIYIPQEQKLYIVFDGQFKEYSSSIISEPDEGEDTEQNKFVIENLQIFNSDGYVVFNSDTKFKFSIGGNEYLTMENEIIKIYKTIEIQKESIIQSPGASEDSGFRLYYTEDGYVLEIDKIICRQCQQQDESQSPRLDESTIYSEHNNIILQSTLDDQDNVVCTLKYSNKFEENQMVYIYLSYENFNYIVSTIIYSQDGSKFVDFMLNGEPAPQDIVLQVKYNDNQEKRITIKKGNSIEVINFGNLEQLTIDDMVIIDGPKNLIIEGYEDYNLVYDKVPPYECKILSIDNQNIILEIPQDFKQTFISSCKNSIICVADSQLIKIQDNNIDLLDRSQNDTRDNIHTRIGIVKEEEFSQLQECPSQKDTINIGIFSDNFIGLNPKLYDTIFKKRCDYPKYDESISIPEDFKEDKYNQVVPNIQWIKELLKITVPQGTITMFNGSSPLPDTWAVCDGTNGTPNLIGNFIKAGTTSGEVGGKEEIELTLDNLPSHTHTFESGTVNTSENGEHSHSYYKTKDGDSDNTNDRTIQRYSELAQTSTDGKHSHTLDLSSAILSTEGKGIPLKWEPKFYSLIFIMKL